MNVPLLVAGSLALLAAAVHGAGGEVLVVRRLSPSLLPRSPFGGPVVTKLMIRVTWHITTIAFLAVGAALVLSGSVLDGEAARAVGLVAAWAATGIAAVVLPGGVAQARRSLGSWGAGERKALLHPGPAVLTAIPVLAWLGIA